MWEWLPPIKPPSEDDNTLGHGCYVLKIKDLTNDGTADFSPYLPLRPHQKDLRRWGDYLVVPIGHIFS